MMRLNTRAGTINQNIGNQLIYNRKLIINMKIQKLVTFNGLFIQSTDVLFRLEWPCCKQQVSLIGDFAN